MPKYKLRTETIIDIIDKIPTDRIETLMAELTEIILQAKLSVDLSRALDPSSTINLGDLVWNDDGKGSVVVNHTISDGKTSTKIRTSATVRKS